MMQLVLLSSIMASHQWFTMTSSSIKGIARRAWKTTDTICEITSGESLGCLDSVLQTFSQPDKVVQDSHGFVTYDCGPPRIFTSL
jgi:hypothetical protein